MNSEINQSILSNEYKQIGSECYIVNEINEANF